MGRLPRLYPHDAAQLLPLETPSDEARQKGPAPAGPFHSNSAFLFLGYPTRRPSPTSSRTSTPPTHQHRQRSGAPPRPHQGSPRDLARHGAKSHCRRGHKSPPAGAVPGQQRNPCRRVRNRRPACSAAPRRGKRKPGGRRGQGCRRPGRGDRRTAGKAFPGRTNHQRSALVAVSRAAVYSPADIPTDADPAARPLRVNRNTLMSAPGVSDPVLTTRGCGALSP